MKIKCKKAINMPIPKKEDGPKVMQTSYVLLLLLVDPKPQPKPEI
jgi:hypothetical protein